MAALSGGNWFIALPVAGTELMARLEPAPHEVRVFHPDDLHLTVAFLGRVGEERARQAFEAASFAAGPFDVTLGDVVPMGARARYSALSALVDACRADIEAAILPARDAAFGAAGVEPEKRPPKAHITLARPTRKASLAERQAALAWASRLDVRGFAARIDRVALYAWAEDRTERLFRMVAHRPLPTA